MAANYGLTLWDDGDLSPRMQTVTGTLALVQACVRRLQRSGGTLWYDRANGTNLSDFVHQAMRGTWEIETAVESELLKDERVDSVDARAELVDRTRIEMTIAVTPSEGPSFEFVVGVESVTVELLRYREVA